MFYAAILFLCGALIGLVWLVNALWQEMRAQGARRFVPTTDAWGGFAIAAATVGFCAESRSQSVRIASGAAARVLPNGETCESCGWEGYADALPTLMLAGVGGLLVTRLIVGPLTRRRQERPEDPTEPPGEAKVPLAIEGRVASPFERFVVAALLASLVLVLWPPSGFPGWPADDFRWAVAQSEELARKGMAPSDACDVFRDGASAHDLILPEADSPMPSGRRFGELLEEMASTCLETPTTSKGPEQMSLYSTPAWTAVPKVTQDRWLDRQVAKTDPCEFLATGAAQCVVVPRARAEWREKAARCLQERGCFPYRPADFIAEATARFFFGMDGPDICEKHAEYLELVASEVEELPPVQSCQLPRF